MMKQLTTKQKKSLTIVVLNRNQSRHLRRLLPTLTFAPVLVLDDESTDKSLDVAKKFKAKFLKHALARDFATQRNYALSRIRTEWVLFVDADERVPKRLALEILEVISKPDALDGYQIERKDIFMGKTLLHGETGRIALTRLGRKKSGVWKRPVHEYWDIPQTGRLVNYLLHYSHRDIATMAQKLYGYASREADYRIDEQQLWRLREMFYPVGKFFYTFFWQKGFLDGIPGFFMAFMMAYHSLMVRLTWWQRLYAPRLSLTLTDLITLWSVPLVLVMMVFGQLTRLPLAASISIYGFEIIMALGICFWMVSWLFERRKFALEPVWYALAGSLLVWGISLFVNADSLGEVVWKASLYWWRYVLYAIWGYALYNLTNVGLWRFPWQRVLVYLGLGLTLFGWIQFLLMPDMRWLYDIGFDDHLNRMVGSLFDPSFLGLTVLLTMVAGFPLPLIKEPAKAVMLFGALLLTYSRSVYLLLIMAITMYSIKARRYGFLFLFVVFFGLGLLVLPKSEGEGVNLMRTYSLNSRAFSTLRGLEYFMDKPWFGMGFNAYKWVVTDNDLDRSIPSLPSGPDNSAVLVLATTGIVGFIPFSLYVFLLYRTLRRGWMRMSLFMILFHSMTNNSWFYPWIMVWIYLLLAASMDEVTVDKIR
jgi:glycosyltransferase involved in cell wall biosynthesis